MLRHRNGAINNRRDCDVAGEVEGVFGHKRDIYDTVAQHGMRSAVFGIIYRICMAVGLVGLVVFVCGQILEWHKAYLLHYAVFLDDMRYMNEICKDDIVMRKLGDRHHCDRTHVGLARSPWEKATFERFSALALCGEHRCEVFVNTMAENKYLVCFLFVSMAVLSVWILVHRSHCMYVTRNYLPLDDPDLYTPLGPGAYCDPDAMTSPLQRRGIHRLTHR